MNTPLHIAFGKGDIFMVMKLIKAGASLNNLNNDFQTPLAYDTEKICKKLNLLQGMVTQKRNIRNIFKLKRNKSLIKISTDNNQLLSAKTSNNVQYNDKK